MKVTVYADGGSRGNPGVAGSGTAVFDAATKELLREIVYAVGRKSTNNVAEYHGLLRGLEAAAELGATEVYVFMDSKLVVEQMSGRWKIKHPDMQKLAMQARKLSERFDRVAYTWVPRAQNNLADKLSNDAMDAAAAGHEPGVVGGTQADADADAAGVGDEAEQTGQAGWWKATSEPPTTLVLLRHGQTAFSATKRYAGRADAELDETGRAQAAAAATALSARGGIDAVVTSPLLRCRATAEAVAEQLDLGVRVVEDLQECDFGDWDGKTYDEARDDNPELHAAWMADGELAPPNGESYDEVNQRVTAVRKALVADYPGQTVLVVTHVNPIKSFVRQALAADAGIYQRLHLDIGSLSIIDFYSAAAGATPVLRAFNDTYHLR